jgi:alanyl-tRNA synthetase
MTNRLYYNDPYLRVFDASIESMDRRETHLVVTLDSTAFYPTSGGQPFDTGTLGPWRVIETVDQENGTIDHIVSGSSGEAIPAVGDRVHGEVDWPRRFDHMQQHTGQHVLSAAFERLFRVRTVSFHLGAEASTVDLGREVSVAEIDAAENEANRVVWEDRPVTIRYATADEAARMPLRKESAREGTLRLIEVADFDLSACGGTHVARTGAIGIIAVSGWERFKGGSRIEFLCGGRALSRFRTSRDTMSSLVRLLSVTAGELPDAATRLLAEARDQKRAIAGLQNELAAFRADALAASAVNGFVGRSLDADAGTLKALATAVSSGSGFTVVLVSTGQPALVVIARSADVAVKADELLAALLARFGGRGGGKAALAQGGGLQGSPDAILAAARSLATA